MRRILIIVIILTLSNSVRGEKKPIRTFGFERFTIKSKELGSVNYYVTKNKLDSKKPILLYIDGSGALPLFQYTQRGIRSTVPIDYKLLSESYHVILISKPGVPFIDSVRINYELGYPEYDVPEEYSKRLSLK